jgi:hypothetical protein
VLALLLDARDIEAVSKGEEVVEVSRLDPKLVIRVDVFEHEQEGFVGDSVVAS